VVDDFGIKYVGRENAEHLMMPIKKHYEISSDWKESAYCGLKIDWDYANGPVDLYMTGCIKTVLHTYQHLAPARAEHTSHKWIPPICGAKTQYVEDDEDIPFLSPNM
jgi:hypothetical protein